MTQTQTTPSKQVRRSSAEIHFELALHRAIARIMHNIQHKLQPPSREMIYQTFPFLSAYEAFSADALQTRMAGCEADADSHLPLRALRDHLGISDAALMVLLAAGIPEEDLQFGALFATLQRPTNSRYPTIGLLNWLLSDADQATIDAYGHCRELAQQGLLAIKEADDVPHLEWTVRVDLPIWMALRGDVATQPTPQIARQSAADFPDMNALILPDSVHEQISQLPAMVHHQQLDALVLRGMVGVGRRTVLGSLARQLGRDVLLLNDYDESSLPLLGGLATLTNAVPIMRLDAIAGQALTINQLKGYRGVVGITMGRTGGLKGTLVERALTLQLPAPRYRERLRFWEGMKCPIDDQQAEAIIHQFMLTGGRIEQVATLADIQRQIDGRQNITMDDIQSAMRSLNRQSLETLATPLTPIADWHKLVVPPRIEEALAMLHTRCRMRENLLAHVGRAFDDNLNRGVRALFSGPSGTGKTYAVRVLAGTLNMDVYRVDLSSIVNKYIGETEKNLNAVFTYAEELDVLLLLDEGDSLMTRRTDVGGANDRYANLETNFLLQRLEAYEGIVIVTTNAAQRIDDAFMRRLDVVIDFERPEIAQRQRLWEAHLPPQHAIADAYLAMVIQRCDLTGGQIRNVALNASLLALTHDEQVTAVYLEESLQREYQKASLPYPLTRRL